MTRVLAIYSGGFTKSLHSKAGCVVTTRQPLSCTLFPSHAGPMSLWDEKD